MKEQLFRCYSRTDIDEVPCKCLSPWFVFGGRFQVQPQKVALPLLLSEKMEHMSKQDVNHSSLKHKLVEISKTIKQAYLIANGALQ